MTKEQASRQPDEATGERLTIERICLFVGVFAAIALLAVFLGWNDIRTILLWFGALLASCLLVFLLVEAFRTNSSERRVGLVVGATIVTIAGMAFAIILAIFPSSGPVGLSSSELELASAVIEVEYIERDTFQPDRSPKNGFVGTGFVFEKRDERLRLYTNAHVLGLSQIVLDSLEQRDRRADIVDYQISVRFPSRTGASKEVPVRRIGICSAMSKDIAILEVEARDLVEGEDYVVVPTTEHSLKSLLVKPRDRVVAVGAPSNRMPMGEERSIAGVQSEGTINQIGNFNSDGSTWIMHSSPISNGNSGGPLLLERNDRFYWIGINTRKHGDGSFYYALSADETSQAKFEWAAADAWGAAKLISKVYRFPIGVEPKQSDPAIAKSGDASQTGLLFSEKINPPKFATQPTTSFRSWPTLGLIALLLSLGIRFLAQKK